MPDFSTRARRRALGAVDGALLAVAVLATAAAAHAASAAWADLRVAQQALEATRREADLPAERARALEARREGGGEALASQILLTAESPPPRVLADLTALMPPDVRLDGISFFYESRVRVDVRVVARRAAAYDLFLERLGQSPLFEAVVPGPENREGEVQASVQMTYRREPPR